MMYLDFSMIQAKEYPDFITVTCLQWKYILAENETIIIDSLTFLVKQNSISVYAFCLKSNHIHLIRQMLGNHKRPNVQRDFLKYTGQKILERLTKTKSRLLHKLRVNAKDRMYQVWERNALSISLNSDKVFFQKLNYYP
jgi:putative transposase